VHPFIQSWLGLRPLPSKLTMCGLVKSKVQRQQTISEITLQGLCWAFLTPALGELDKCISLSLRGLVFYRFFFSTNDLHMSTVFQASCTFLHFLIFFPLFCKFSLQIKHTTV
jgi:hypothetical protein